MFCLHSVSGLRNASFQETSPQWLVRLTRRDDLFLRNSFWITLPDVSGSSTSLISTKTPCLRFSHLIEWTVTIGLSQLQHWRYKWLGFRLFCQAQTNLVCLLKLLWWILVYKRCVIKYEVGRRWHDCNDGRSWTLHIQVSCATQGHVDYVFRSSTQLLQNPLYKCQTTSLYWVPWVWSDDIVCVSFYVFLAHAPVFWVPAETLLLPGLKLFILGNKPRGSSEELLVKRPLIALAHPASEIWNARRGFREYIMEHFVELF